MAKNDGGSAFPARRSDPELRKRLLADEKLGIGLIEMEQLTSYHGGMSLRDYFAAKAMQGYMLRNAILKDDEVSCIDIAFWSYDLADAMLKERSK